jgi:hypothetical protein
MARPAAWFGLVLVVIALPARADRIRFRGGGEVRGMIVSGEAPEGKVLVQTETGSKPLVLDRDRIVEIVPEADALDEYFARLEKLPATAEAEYELGLWCDAKRMGGLAQQHYQRAAERDPTHAAAHKKLGHVLHEGVWMSVEEQKRAQGLVLHKGRWVSREEFERIEQRAVSSAERAARVREIQVLLQNIDTGEAASREDADRRLHAIDDPEAIPALLQVLGPEAPAHRTRLARILGAIPGEESREALIGCLLVEDDPSVRRAGIDELLARDEPETVPSILGRLSARNPRLTGRAATLLAELGAESAVPKLIPLLLRIERRHVWVPGPAVASTPPQGMSIVTGESYGVLTGPAVGNGAVAYGAYSTPFLSGVAMGSPGTTRRVPSIRIVTIQHRNAEVLAALQSLTGRDFGYDSAAWRRWWGQTHRPEEPVKRVRQP